MAIIVAGELLTEATPGSSLPQRTKVLSFGLDELCLTIR